MTNTTQMQNISSTNVVANNDSFMMLDLSANAPRLANVSLTKSSLLTSTYVNPNTNNTFTTVTTSGGTRVNIPANSSAVWFDVTALSGNSSQYRGAVINYQALIEGHGFIVGNIVTGAPSSGENTVITETKSETGNTVSKDIKFGNHQYNSNTNLCLANLTCTEASGLSANAVIQWTALVFYAQDPNVG